jgi:hypothetical protein
MKSMDRKKTKLSEDWLLDRMVRKSDGPMNIKNALIREKITGSLSDLGEIEREK